ncbi:MAG TPA: Asd/ArgC dimerization domain-containing protein [Candidatus Udaeobacter sp.]|nr:Asd/ArgC dimerization domain-containing protein [Candidatus Udaeobacter sp.]
MPAFERESQRIVIAGASSLLGAELKSLLEESKFASWDLRLVDEEIAAGTLTEAGGEPVVIQPVEEGSFEKARFVFFSGSADFTKINLSAARESGATVIDLSSGALAAAKSRVWFSFRDAPESNETLYVIPSAPGAIAGHLLDALGRVGLVRLGIVFHRPVSEAGRAGIEELETQCAQLLSFQSVGQQVFDTQVAYSLLDRFGASSKENLGTVRERIRREVGAADGKGLVEPSIQVLHAPVFYGYTFSAITELNSQQKREALTENLKKTGILIQEDASMPLGNLSVAGDSAIHVGLPESDPAQPGTWWFWGAADNIRLPAWNAVKLAEKLVP